MTLRDILQKKINDDKNKEDEKIINIMPDTNIKYLVELKINNKCVYIIPPKISNLIKDNSPFKNTKIKSNNIFDFSDFECYDTFKKLLIYIYKNYIPTPLEIINEGIMNDIIEINYIMDYINIDGFTEYISTICKYIKHQ